MLGTMKDRAGPWRVAHALTPRQVGALCDLYRRQWWSGGRTPAGVRRMLARSPVVVALVDAESGAIGGFCRALSDGVYRAAVYDVMVAEDQQGAGLGKVLLDALMDHPLMAGVERVELVCHPELVPFYEKWGFRETPDDWRTLVRTRTPVG